MGSIRKFDRDDAIISMMNDIWRSGFDSISVKAVSEKLGITRSSFYNAFESREALFLEALDLYFNHAPYRKLATFSESSDPLILLTQVFKEVCVALCRDPEHRGCMAVNSVSELVGVNPVLGPVLENAFLNNIKCFEALLEESIRQGLLPENTDAHILALALQNTLMGLNTMSQLVKSEPELWSATRITLEALNVYRELQY